MATTPRPVRIDPSKIMNIPPRVQAGDGAYRLVLMRVEGVYDDRPPVGGYDVPAELLFLDDDDVTEISEGARYVTAYVPEAVFGIAPPKKES